MKQGKLDTKILGWWLTIVSTVHKDRTQTDWFSTVGRWLRSGARNLCSELPTSHPSVCNTWEAWMPFRWTGICVIITHNPYWEQMLEKCPQIDHLRESENTVHSWKGMYLRISQRETDEPWTESEVLSRCTRRSSSAITAGCSFLRCLLMVCNDITPTFSKATWSNQRHRPVSFTSRTLMLHTLSHLASTPPFLGSV